jgi:hypothetical protein
MEVAMRGSAKSQIHPNELAMLSDVLNEALSAARPADETAKRELAKRLAPLLVNLFTAGIADRVKLKSIIFREIGPKRAN